MNPVAFIGRAPHQVEMFNRDVVDPYLTKYHHFLEEKSEDAVNVLSVCWKQRKKARADR